MLCGMSSPYTQVTVVPVLIQNVGGTSAIADRHLCSVSSAAHPHAHRRDDRAQSDTQCARRNTTRRGERAQKLRSFLTQPFFVAEPFTKQPGRFVRLEDTPAGCRANLDGGCDELPAAAFLFGGDGRNPPAGGDVSAKSGTVRRPP